MPPKGSVSPLLSHYLCFFAWELHWISLRVDLGQANSELRNLRNHLFQNPIDYSNDVCSSWRWLNPSTGSRGWQKGIPWALGCRAKKLRHDAQSMAWGHRPRRAWECPQCIVCMQLPLRTAPRSRWLLVVGLAASKGPIVYPEISALCLCCCFLNVWPVSRPGRVWCQWHSFLCCVWPIGCSLCFGGRFCPLWILWELLIFFFHKDTGSSWT